MKHEGFPEKVAIVSEGRFHTAVCTVCGKSLGSSADLDVLRVNAVVHECEPRDKREQTQKIPKSG